MKEIAIKVCSVNRLDISLVAMFSNYIDILYRFVPLTNLIENIRTNFRPLEETLTVKEIKNDKRRS